MISIKETAQQIRKELKELGYNSNKLSVRSGYVGYSAFINVNIKFPVDCSLKELREREDIKKIKSIIKKYESIDRCEVTGETLMGGNTYITLGYNGYTI